MAERKAETKTKNRTIRAEVADWKGSYGRKMIHLPGRSSILSYRLKSLPYGLQRSRELGQTFRERLKIARHALEICTSTQCTTQGFDPSCSYPIHPFPPTNHGHILLLDSIIITPRLTSRYPTPINSIFSHLLSNPRRTISRIQYRSSHPDKVGPNPNNPSQVR